MIQLAIHEAINGRDLDYTIARATMEEMMDGTATDIEMATLLTALRMKGETITEITACAEVMREKGAHIEPKGAVMDIVGTGGDEVGLVQHLPRPPHSWRRRAACRWQSTATGRFRPSRARLTCSRSWALSCRVARAERKGAGGNGHLLPVRTGLSQVHEERRACPPRAWASGTIFNVLGRCPIRRARLCSCSACTMKASSCRWRRC